VFIAVRTIADRPYGWRFIVLQRFMMVFDRAFLPLLSIPMVVMNLTSVAMAQVRDVAISTQAIDLQPQSFSLSSLPDLAERSTAGAIAQSEPTPVTPDQPAGSPPSTAQNIPRPAAQGTQVPPFLNEGVTIDRTYIYLRNPGTDPAKDDEFKQQIEAAFGLRAGSSFSSLFASRGISQVTQLPFVKSAEYRLYASNAPGQVTIAILVTLQPVEAKPSETVRPPRGILVDGNFAQFPTLYESDRALLKVYLNGSLGIFSDSHAWFGNPQNFLSGAYFPRGTTTWGEFSLETGLAGITQIGTDPYYLYGAATYTLSTTVQPDIFREDTRFFDDVEQLYAGLLYAERGKPYAFNLSGGRQKFQLNQGFLFSQFSGSANALDRAGSFLNPRVAYRTTALADLRAGNFRWRGFFLQPDELAIADSKTQYLGTSFIYNNNRSLDASISYITVPQSDRAYALPSGQTETRAGLQVINPRLRLPSLFGVEGLWAEAEYAYQFNNRFNMAANGGYIWLGYTATNWAWRPSISYRFAGFSGDNPRTSAYERFDPLQAGGLTDWLQGLSLGKVFNNSNNFTHRISLEVQPSESVSVSLTYFYRYADQLNNLGGSRPLQVLQSRDLGHEAQLLARYFVSQNFLLQGLTSIAFPGAAIRRAVSNSTDPWFTVQFSVYMFF
jgi:hypothetical protein